MGAGFELVGRNDAGQTTFLGRTGGSWFKITVFYIIYYTFLFFLAYGTISLRQNMLDTTTIDGTVYGVNTPYIDTRISQAGLKVWPHHQAQGKVDDNNQKLKLEAWGAVDDKRPVGCTYADYVELFFLGTTTLPDKEKDRKHLHIGSPKLKPYCVSEDNCMLKKLFGDDFNTKTGLELDFIEFEDSENATGKAKINWGKLRAKVTDGTNVASALVTKPFVFLVISKKIDFVFHEVFDFADVNGVKPSYKRSEYFQTYRSEYLENNATNTPRAWFHCYLKNNSPSKDDKTYEASCKAEDKCPTIAPIVPYIQYTDYKYSGFEGGDRKTAKNQAALDYISPFAIFQVTITDATKIPSGDKRPFRCNTLLRNVEYPYWGNKALTGNQLLMQAGNGYAEFGFEKVTAKA